MYKKPNFEYKNLSKAQQIKRQRLYKRIYELISQNQCLFLTFTFNDETLKKTTEQTRLRYIKQFLNEQAESYILNRDFGKTTEREHYHAIAKAKTKDMFYLSAYKLGKISAIKINQLKRYKRANKSLDEIAEHLTQHAIKNSTKESKIIYSRKAQNTKPNPYRKQIEIINNKTNQTKTKQTKEQKLYKSFFDSFFLC